MSEFRWRLADEERDGQPALFGVDGLTGPERGTGRLSGLEFLHVTTKRILNEVPARSRMPFRWTINVYRGCSHACAYCLAGDTRVLLANGRTKQLARLKVGDRVYGTVRNGRTREYVPTAVLAHWQTEKPAFRLELTGGTSLVASGDHRFLTSRGWRQISVLAPGDRLTGMGGFDESDDDSPLRVDAVHPLHTVLPMYDITTGTGDFIANGVVSHNCFARPTHEYLGLDIGADFERKIVVKINAVERLRVELNDPGWTHEGVAMGTNTDPYQRCEGKYKLTRGVVQALTEHANPFSILTKSALVLRDLDLISEAARRTDVSVNFSVGTLDERVWRATEPGTPHPRRRIEAMRQLAEAGVRTGALIAPVLPGLSDSPEQLGDVSSAIRAAGGQVMGTVPLHLRPGVREHFLGWLAGYDPRLHADYLRRYAKGSYAPEHYAEHIRRLVAEPNQPAGARSPTGPW
ncbi:MAG TPA: radical SAM protein [Jatrophihabitantaceae bacterium]